MKQFFKYVFATVVGIVCVWIFAVIMSLVMFTSMMVSESATPSLDKGSVLRINLNGQINERSEDDPLASLIGNDAFNKQGLEDILKAIRVAKTNDKVVGIYLEGGALQADYASLQAVRRALIDFKKSKKFVVSYADQYAQGSYYLASAADKVWLNPQGMLDWHGIAAQPIFFKNLLEKIGVKMQVFKVGTFKSAVEPFILTEMSEANREQVTSYISDIWGVLARDVASARKVSQDSLNAYANRYAALAEPTDYVKYRLVDSLCYVDGVRDCLRRLTKTEEVKFVDPVSLAKLDEPVKAKDKVTVYYAEGDIVDVASTSTVNGGSQQIVGSKVVADLDKLMNDDEVKAVVLRINSGGGSAYASEQMWRAIQLLKARKPVVVSMSGLAASGGYYMSCGADYIYAEPTTLTGSIGIFGMIPDASGLLTEKLGLNFDVVKTNESADFGAMGRAFNPAEAAAMQGYVNRGYRLFLKRVADGRKMKVEEVDKIAQGRVWTGNQALKIKLVDRLGGLDEAISEAARRAKLAEYAVVSYPEKVDFVTSLLNQTTKKDYLEGKLRSSLGVYYAPLRFVTGAEGKASIQARMFYEPNLR